MTILEAMHDPKLFGPWFKDDSWAGWQAFLASLFGLDMTEAQAAAFRQCTGRTEPPSAAAREAWGLSAGAAVNRALRRWWRSIWPASGITRRTWRPARWPRSRSTPRTLARPGDTRSSPPCWMKWPSGAPTTPQTLTARF